MNPEIAHSPPGSKAEARPTAHVVAVGEVLWDLFEDGRRLGGAPLNFAAHLRRLGHPVSLISAVGDDPLGTEAAAGIAQLGVDASFLQSRQGTPTGTAGIRLGPDGSPQFEISRPAAYDRIELSAGTRQALRRLSPAWIYYGTLLASREAGRHVLTQLFEDLNGSLRFFDPNLRPGSDAGDLLIELLACADVVKLNEDELDRVSQLTGLPASPEQFCEPAARHFGWRACAVTLGKRGCALWADGSFARAPAPAVTVVDTVGAGDAFAAALLHGLSEHWPPEKIAGFANARAAAVAAQAGALPA